MQSRKGGYDQAKTAARAGFSESTARRAEKNPVCQASAIGCDAVAPTRIPLPMSGRKSWCRCWRRRRARGRQRCWTSPLLIVAGGGILAGMSFHEPNALQIRVVLADEPAIWRLLICRAAFISASCIVPSKPLSAGGTATSTSSASVACPIAMPDSASPSSRTARSFDESEVRLRAFDRSEGLSFLYVYDFGDNWKHVVEFERPLPSTRAARSHLHRWCACPTTRGCWRRPRLCRLPRNRQSRAPRCQTVGRRPLRPGMVRPRDGRQRRAERPSEPTAASASTSPDPKTEPVFPKCRKLVTEIVVAHVAAVAVVAAFLIVIPFISGRIGAHVKSAATAATLQPRRRHAAVVTRRPRG
jgi:Plasmid pRiA4b ORF-3-like protein